MTADERYMGSTRASLLRRLAGINRSEKRHGVPPRFTVGDAQLAELPLDQLWRMVRREADHLDLVSRAMKGTR